MVIVAFETATPSGGVALMADGRVLGEVRIQGSQSHSQHCLALAEVLLHGARLKWADVTHLAASHGPGAFTGVRVGLTLAKGLAWSLGKPVVTVNTLDAMAFGAFAGEAVDLVLPVQDARMGEVYAACFRPEAGELVREGEDLILSPEALVTMVGERRVLICGEGERSYAAAFPEAQFLRARADRLLASPGAVAVLAERLARAGRVQTPSEVEAVYLREAVQPR